MYSTCALTSSVYLYNNHISDGLCGKLTVTKMMGKAKATSMQRDGLSWKEGHVLSAGLCKGGTPAGHEDL